MIPSAQVSPRIAALLEKTRRNRARLVFSLDATASRESSWDAAASLTAGMFLEASKIGGLDVQLCWFRGLDEVSHSPWLADARELVAQMDRVKCQAGSTQISKLLAHVRGEHAHDKVHAMVFIGDAIEEKPEELYDAAGGLGIPLFMFEEGDNIAINFDPRGGHTHITAQSVENVFRKMAQLSGGAYAKFDASAAEKLGALLRAVGAFATGGIAALANLRTEESRKLLSQMTKNG